MVLTNFRFISGLALFSAVNALPTPMDRIWSSFKAEVYFPTNSPIAVVQGQSSSSAASTTAADLIPVLIGGPGAKSTVVNATVVIGGGQDTVSSLDIPQGGPPKYVFAHFMVGNTYSYTKDVWRSQVLLAQEASIDGFALNIGSDDWQPARVDDAYSVAEDLGTDFKLFLSFDMTVLPSGSTQDADRLQEYIRKYADHPNQMTYGGQVFASTFSGENSFFGQPSPVQGWEEAFRKPLANDGFDICFVPSIFVPPGDVVGSWSQTVQGIFPWNAGWPVALTSQNEGVIGSTGPLGAHVLQKVRQLVGSISPDMDFIDAIQSAARSITRIANPSPAALQSARKMYMASISPAFFTHYGPNTYNKNWLYVADDHLYSTRWETLINNRDQVDMVEIITWNDYGESSYIGPIEVDQPMSNAWVDGFDHQGWLKLTAYYAQAFKTGVYPTIQKDSVTLVARPHTKDAVASSDSVGRPTNWELTRDRLWVDVLLTSPATVTLSTSESQSQSFDASAGPSRFSIPLTVGGYISATVTRDGETVLESRPSTYSFVDDPKTYNFNFFVEAQEST
ncbi:hypothetical protein FRB99_004630 [Tulasnella sp. 403]|nr:hypothetical protein FRB99_004630 [Tulasnella sp. 403]